MPLFAVLLLTVVPGIAAGLRATTAKRGREHGVLLGASLEPAAPPDSDSEGANVSLIPRTEVPMPSDYDDYARSRTPWRLWPSGAPGVRVDSASPCLFGGCPAYKAYTSPEVYLDWPKDDVLGAKCAPGGVGTGHNIYNVEDPELIPFIVPKGAPNRKDTAVVVVPGGGFVLLAWDTEGIAQAEYFNSIGISAFVLKYRIPVPNSEISVMDAKRAMQLVRSRAEEYDLNASRIGLMGFSAGGQVVFDTVSNEDKSPYVDEVAQHPHMPDFLMSMYAVPMVPTSNKTLLQHYPPLLMLIAQDDPCCLALTNVVFARALREAGNSQVTFHLFPDGKHGWAHCAQYPHILRDKAVCTWREDYLVPFLEAQVLHEKL